MAELPLGRGPRSIARRAKPGQARGGISGTKYFGISGTQYLIGGPTGVMRRPWAGSFPIAREASTMVPEIPGSPTEEASHGQRSETQRPRTEEAEAKKAT